MQSGCAKSGATYDPKAHERLNAWMRDVAMPFSADYGRDDTTKLFHERALLHGLTFNLQRLVRLGATT